MLSRRRRRRSRRRRRTLYYPADTSREIKTEGSIIGVADRASVRDESMARRKNGGIFFRSHRDNQQVIISARFCLLY